MHRLLSLFVAALLSFGAAPCLAAARRVAVVKSDPELERQLSLALEAWEVETLALDVAAPAGTQPEAMNEAAELATRLQLDGVVWITEATQGSVLWVYDALKGEVITRAVAERPPFGSATAAGLALSVKTTLRASVEPPPPPPPPLPPLVARPAPSSAPQPRAPSPMPRAASRAQLSALLDAQAIAADSRRAWYSIHGALWLGRARRVGLGLRVGAGGAVSVRTSSVNARFRELSAGPSLELKLASAPLFTVQCFVGGTLHASTLASTLMRDGAVADVTRYHFALDAGARWDLRLAQRFLVGLQLGAGYFLGYQRYLVEGAPVLSPWRLVPSGGAHVGFELY